MTNWQTKRLGELSKVQTGPFGAQLHEKDYIKTNGTPIITVENISGGVVKLLQNTPLVSDSDKARLHRYVLREGDIVFSRVGSVDRSAYVTASADGWMFSGRLLRVHPSEKLDAKYLNYHLNDERTKNLIRNLAVGGTMPSLNTEILNFVLIHFPGKTEQQRIVGVLEVWDEYIEKLEQKIALKEQLKKGLMQQLFARTGDNSRRLTIASIFDFLPSYSHSRAEMTYEARNNDPVYCIHYGDIHTKFDSYIEIGKASVPHLLHDEKIPTDKQLHDGDVVVADASEDYDGVGRSVEIKNLSDSICIAGLHTFALRPNKNLVAYGYGTLIFKDANVHKSLMKIATYSKVYGITKSGFSGIKIDLPSLDDQRTIVEVTKALDDNITIMRQKRQMLLLQKKYLLKNLITGTIRTPEDLEIAK